jgi:hypothetical protein
MPSEPVLTALRDITYRRDIASCFIEGFDLWLFPTISAPFMLLRAA